MNKLLKYFCFITCLLIAVTILLFLGSSSVSAQCADLGERCNSTADCCGTSNDLICFPFGTKRCIRPAGWTTCNNINDCCGYNCSARSCIGGECCGRYLEACSSDAECCTSIGWFCRPWSATNPNKFCKCSSEGCSEWVDQGCAPAGGCTGATKYQTRSGCKYSCAETSQCVSDCMCGSPPTVPTLVAPPHNTWINYDPVFRVISTDPEGERIRAYFEISGYGSHWGDWVDSGEYSSWGAIYLGNCGQYYWRAYARDYCGLIGDWSGYWLVKVDKDAPTADINYPSGTINQTQLNVALNESDGCSAVQGGEVQIRINDGTWTAYSNTIDDFVYNTSGTNCYRFRYRVSDNAGNVSAWATGQQVCVDFSVPTCSIDYPNGWINSTSFNVGLTEDDPGGSVAAGNVDVRSRAHGGSFGSWIDNGLPNNGSTIDDFSYTGTNCQDYQFRYQVTDNAGNVSAWADPGYITSIDTDVPTVNINYPSGDVNSLTFAVTLDESDGCSGIKTGEVQVSTNNGPWAAYGNTINNFTFTGENTACYKLRYRATDNANNISTWATGNDVCIDFSVPTCSIDYPNGWINSTSFNVGLTEDDPGGSVAAGNVDVRSRAHGGSFGSWIDNGLPNNGSTIDDFSYTGTNCQDYQFRYQVTDNAGNVSAWADPGYVTQIDTNPPTPNISYPSGTVTSVVFTVTLDESDDCSGIKTGEVQISTDGETWAVHVSTINSFEFTGSYGHSYQFRYRVQDNANNLSDWATGPVVNVVALPQATPSSINWTFCPGLQAQLNWTYSDISDLPQVSFQIQIDNNDDFSSPMMDTNEISGSTTQYILTNDVISNLSDGVRYYWQIRVRNSANDWSNWATDSNLIIFLKSLDYYSSF